jgi:hypothetical protein
MHPLDAKDQLAKRAAGRDMASTCHQQIVIAIKILEELQRALSLVNSDNATKAHASLSDALAAICIAGPAAVDAFATDWPQLPKPPVVPRVAMASPQLVNPARESGWQRIQNDPVTFQCTRDGWTFVHAEPDYDRVNNNEGWSVTTRYKGRIIPSAFQVPRDTLDDALVDALRSINGI